VQRRSLLWTALVQHRAVLPWVREVLRLAQAAEDDAPYRSTQATLAWLLDETEDLEADLREHDPAWAAGVLDPLAPVRRRGEHRTGGRAL
jgi:hypothetical protein